ncbi:hypothetical protein EAE92_15905 [Photorhabdus hainanensis]|uniref:hypothetical protein n=1 Tax=Photorhabdus hainanensis TaxID=1004166 RepID=UPI001BD64BA2|nr:hypothetical protein [Photorhabdus hainanensis]MBS9434008.1 hypothetical protein [Photorhabdus hainanensis]
MIKQCVIELRYCINSFSEQKYGQQSQHSRLGVRVQMQEYSVWNLKKNELQEEIERIGKNSFQILNINGLDIFPILRY